MSVDWRDWEIVAQPQSDFARIFGAKPTYKYVRKASLSAAICVTATTAALTAKTALHWVLHHTHGAALRDRLGLPPDEAGRFAGATRRKCTLPKTRGTENANMTKTLREVGEAGFTKMVEKYAKTVHPTLTREQAFTKVFTEDSDEGRAIRRAYQIAKQGVARRRRGRR